MGQAKARGSLETRIKESKAKKDNAEIARKEEIDRIEQNLTPKERNRRKNLRMIMSTLVALSVT